MAVELWRTSDGYEVRTLYYDGLSRRSQLRPFSVGGCEGLRCSLDAFVARSSALLPWNWDQECGLLTKVSLRSSLLLMWKPECK